MALAPKPLDELDPALVDQAHSLLAGLLREYAPAAELRRGALGDLSLHLAAVAHASLQDLAERTWDGLTLGGVAADPGAADPDLLEALLENYRVRPAAGGAAAGSLVVVVSAAADVTVDAGAVFTVGDASFAASAAVTARASAADVVQATDVLLREAGPGAYFFSVAVTALAEGPAGNVGRGLPATPASPPENFVSAATEVDFAGGSAAEPAADLVRRAQAGFAAPGFGSRLGLLALLRRTAALQDAVDVEAAGWPHEEQRRHHGLFPVAGGGKVDAYVRSQALWESVTVRRTASLLAKTADGGLWQLSLGAGQSGGVPAFYDVTAVARADTGAACVVDEEVRGLDLTEAPDGRDLTTAEEAAYTAYQTATLRVLDGRTDTADLEVGRSQAEFDVTVRLLPQVAAAQDAFDDPEHGSLGLDVLAKAPVPCFLAVALTVRRPAGAAEPTSQLAALKDALAAYVGGLGFVGRLSAAELVARAQPFLPTGHLVTDADLLGRLRRPDGTRTLLRSRSALAVPDEPERMVSARTVGFFLAAADVTVNLEDA
jgi:hypothetical protein